MVERAIIPDEDVLDCIVQFAEKFFVPLQVVMNELKLADVDWCAGRRILG